MQNVDHKTLLCILFTETKKDDQTNIIQARCLKMLIDKLCVGDDSIQKCLLIIWRKCSIYKLVEENVDICYIRLLIDI